MKQLLDFSSDLNFWILLAFLFLIPFSIAGCSILLALLLIPFFLCIVRKKKLLPLPFFFWAFMAFAFFSLVSTIFSVDLFTSLQGNKELFRFFLFPLCLLSLNTARRVRLSLFTVMASASLSAALGIGQWAWKGISLNQRLKGLTSHWMTYSGLLMLAFMFFFLFWLLSRNKRKFVVLIPLLLLILVVIALSLTRNVWVGIIISLFFFLLFFKSRWMVAGVPILIILLLLLPRTVQKRFFSIVDPNDPSNRDRIHMVYTGWMMFRDYPITGVGTNNVEKLFSSYVHPRADKKDNPHLHNNFLQILAERGMLGFLSFVAAWVFFFAELKKKVKSRIRGLQTISASVLFAVVAFLIAGLFEYNFGDAEVRFLLLYFMALPFLSLSEGDYDHIETS